MPLTVTVPEHSIERGNLPLATVVQPAGRLKLVNS
jgi:hypothetical protein